MGLPGDPGHCAAVSHMTTPPWPAEGCAFQSGAARGAVLAAHRSSGMKVLMIAFDESSFSSAFEVMKNSEGGVKALKGEEQKRFINT